jgi:hypothetical protein
MFVMCEVLFDRLMSVQILTISLLGLEPMPCISVALMAQYLNVRQRKLGTINILTVHILQHDSADTGPLPTRDFCMVISNYYFFFMFGGMLPLFLFIFTLFEQTYNIYIYYSSSTLFLSSWLPLPINIARQ